MFYNTEQIILRFYNWQVNIPCACNLSKDVCSICIYSCPTLKNTGLHVMLMYIQTFDWTIICGSIIIINSGCISSKLPLQLILIKTIHHSSILYQRINSQYKLLSERTLTPYGHRRINKFQGQDQFTRVIQDG